MPIVYIGKLHRTCQMCSSITPHTYLDNQEISKGLFPEVEWKDIYICEICAKRESGNKHWKHIKRKVNSV